MSLFHSILSQFQDKFAKENADTELIAVIVSATIGTTIAKECIQIQKGTLRIRTNPTVKMAINLNKIKIINALKEKNITISTIA